MPELRCTVQTCLHNKDFYCALDGIVVGGQQCDDCGADLLWQFRGAKRGRHLQQCDRRGFAEERYRLQGSGVQI